MAEPLKEFFNKEFYEKLSHEFSKVENEFNSEAFLKDVLKNNEALSLNDRMRNSSVQLKKHLPNNYKKSINAMYKVIPHFKGTYTACLFPDFVGLYGLEHFNISMEALKEFTKYGSSEFAIREFLKRDFSSTIIVMNKWAEDKNLHVRRLASEGSRPRLPWSFKLDKVIENPSLTISILEKLKTDNELYVKKSVANHLNDISKDNSKWLISTLKKWDTNNDNTQWIIKHACRTLIKKGNSDALNLFNFEKNCKVDIENFKLLSNKLHLGDSLQFEFNILSRKNASQKIVIDFAIHYVKKSGELSAKVFKLKELYLEPNTSIYISKRHRFQNFTTRKHFSGNHKIEILINGEIVKEKKFDLVV